MENVVASAIIAIVVSVVAAILKQSLTGLSNSLKNNTLATQELTTNYKVHDSEIKAIRGSLLDHSERHDKLEININKVQSELSEVKTDVKILYDRGSNNHPQRNNPN